MAERAALKGSLPAANGVALNHSQVAHNHPDQCAGCWEGS